jgi:hypothetical protein
MTRPLNRLGVASSSILRRGKPVDSGGKEPVPINFLDTTNTAPNTYLACIYDALLGIDNALCGRPAIKRITGLWVGTVVTATLLACCGGGGGGGTTPDTSAPTTTAFPSGGIYGALQTVTLTANESATIYYSTDGNDPIPGSANTTSGESPATGIVIAGGTTTLKYFAVDQAQNQELVHTQTYVVDLVSPTVTVTSGAPGAMGLLGNQDITWQTDEAGAYVVELGGTGTPGTGTVLSAGSVAAASPVPQNVNGAQLTYGVATPLWVYVTDGVGHTGSTSVGLTLKPMVPIAAGGELAQIAILPSGL